MRFMRKHTEQEMIDEINKCLKRDDISHTDFITLNALKILISDVRTLNTIVIWATIIIIFVVRWGW